MIDFGFEITYQVFGDDEMKLSEYSGCYEIMNGFVAIFDCESKLRSIRCQNQFVMMIDREIGALCYVPNKAN